MKDIEQEIKYTIEVLGSVIDEEVREELIWHLNQLLECKRSKLSNSEPKDVPSRGFSLA